jgi:putative transposase
MERVQSAEKWTLRDWRELEPSQSWRTFLANHVQQIAAADFFVVPTGTDGLLFVLVILTHELRQVVHVAVTRHPTAAWTAQQLREAFPWKQTPTYLIHDLDLAFQGVMATAKAMDIKDVRTAPLAPWQNAMSNDSSARSGASASITSSCSTPQGCVQS